MADASLPQDWHQILDHFADTLAGVQASLAKAAACEPMPGDESRAAQYRGVLDEQKAQHAGLENKAAEITRWVDAIESELRVSEDLLRVLLNQTETVRQRLATWAGRAIG